MTKDREMSKEEKNPNSTFDLFKKWVIEPLDDWNYMLRMTMKEMGILDSWDNLIAKGIENPLFYTLFTQMYSYEVANHEILPDDGPILIAAQHQSPLDPITTALAVLHYKKRLPYQFITADLRANPMFNIFTRINRPIFVRKGDSDEQAMEESKKVLGEGHILIMYPEGDIGPGNGKILPFHKGIVRLAYEAKVPIYPVATYGIDAILGKGMKAPKSKGIIKMKFGEPIPFRKLFKEEGNGGSVNFGKTAKRIERTVKKIWTELWIAEQTKEKLQQQDF